MLKIIIVAVLLIGLATGYAFFRYFKPVSPQPNKSTILTSKNPITSTPSAKLNSSAAPNSDTSDLTVPPSPASASLGDKVLYLENKLAVLQRRIELVEKSSGSNNTVTLVPPGPTTSSTSSNKAPSYIWALGSAGSSSAMDWTTITSLSITINPADYPGVKDFQLEVQLQQYQGNGTAHVRLYNNKAGTAVNSSDAQTNSADYTWVTSNPFSLPSGSNTYVLQLKSTTGYQASANNFRIKVNYQ